MNAVGTIGEFFVENQVSIELILIALVLIACIAYVYKKAKKAKAGQSTLSEIDRKVAEINNSVKTIADAQNIHKETFYMNNCPEQLGKCDSMNKIEKLGAQTKPDKEHAEIKASSGAENETLKPKKIPSEPLHIPKEEPKQTLPKEISESSVETPPERPKKYFKRDNGVNKQGKEYTIEELYEQIK